MHVMNKTYLIYNLSGELDDISHLFPNERLARLAAVIAAAGHGVEVQDRANFADLQRLGPEYLKKLGELGFADTEPEYQAGVQREGAAIAAAGYTAVFFNLWHGTGFKFSVDLARELKRRNPSLPVYGIGQKVDWFKEHILRLTGDAFDGLVTGLGYNAVQNFVHGSAPEDCPNLIVRRAGEASETRRETLNVDDFPAPLYEPAVYHGIDHKVRLHTLVLSNQACPNRCAFCVRPENYGRVNVRRQTGRVLAELLGLYRERQVRHFRVEDSTPPARALTDLARGILASDCRGQVRLSGFARVDTNRQEEFGALREAGFLALFFGIESLDDATLKRMRKGTSYPDIRDTLRRAHEAGIATVGSFIFPMPGETRESMAVTLDRLAEIRPWLDSLLVLPAAVYPPTDWGRHPERYGIKMDADYYEKFVAYPLKYLLPLKYWPPAPFRYSILGKDVATLEFSAIFDLYHEFTAHVKDKLALPPIPDYYFLLADLMGKPAPLATRELVQGMINRDYAGLEKLLRPRGQNSLD
jgi:radical SAM superfamily enzyme YgiQ (UPF0313 family)